MDDRLKSEFDEELSQLIQEYKKRGLSMDAIGDSLDWHTQLALTRSGGPEPSSGVNDSF